MIYEHFLRSGGVMMLGGELNIGLICSKMLSFFGTSATVSLHFTPRWRAAPDTGPRPHGRSEATLRGVIFVLVQRGRPKCGHRHARAFLRHRWLFALSDFLIEEGHQIKCFADASSGVYTWWIQRKRQGQHGAALFYRLCKSMRRSTRPSRLALSRLVSYCEDTSVHEPSHKALYDTWPFVLPAPDSPVGLVLSTPVG